MAQQVKAVIFDQDGLMFDTERLVMEGWHMAAGQYGLEISDEFLLSLRGMRPQESRAAFKKRYGEDFPDEKLRRIKGDYCREQVRAKGAPVKKGLKELLAYLKEHGCKMAVATSSGKEWTMNNLRDARISDYFDVCLYGDMTKRCKPDPEIFLLAARMLGEEPSGCMVLEDSVNGNLAAINGGFIAVMVPDLTQPPRELEQRLMAKCDSLLDVIGLFESGTLEFAAEPEGQRQTTCG